MTLRMMPDWVVQKMIRFWGRSVLRILEISLEYKNIPNFDEAYPRVIVCNHQSALDLAWGAAICPIRALVIGKKEVIFIPFINLAWWAFRFIRVDRKDSKKAIASVKGVAEELRTKRRSLLIAPEGTRSPDGNILPFKKGAFHIAIESKASVYPIVVRGAFDLLPKTSLLPKPGKIYLEFLEPIETEDLESKDVDFLIHRVRNKMIKAFESQ